MKFFCGDSTDTFTFMGQDFKGGKYRNAFCACEKGRGSDPAWKTSCQYEFRGTLFEASNAYAATCSTNQPDNIQLDLDNGDLDLANNQDSLDQNS